MMIRDWNPEVCIDPINKIAKKRPSIKELILHSGDTVAPAHRGFRTYPTLRNDAPRS